MDKKLMFGVLALYFYILLCGVPPFLGSTETEEGIAHAIVKGTIDFNRYPWPRVSDEAKDLLKGMLDANPYNRFTVEEVLARILRGLRLVARLKLSLS
ncbi:hypothetical protein P3L10_002053 [Capsicum annuum]